ncbi:MAG: hypothetical protein RJA25_1800 [Bacteroidota bacterium]|jgi:hypothetical protein
MDCKDSNLFIFDNSCLENYFLKYQQTVYFFIFVFNMYCNMDLFAFHNNFLNSSNFINASTGVKVLMFTFFLVESPEMELC